ncbi:MAG: M28 family peptidase [Rubripirellula sp.]|nr:M28 family peptidase [Rubripirellula sp.]
MTPIQLLRNFNRTKVPQLIATLIAIALTENPATLFSQGHTSNAKHSSAAQQQIESQIKESTLRGHIRFLADDLLEGRGPGSRGDQITQLYLQTQFQSLGLLPAASPQAVANSLESLDSGLNGSANVDSSISESPSSRTASENQESSKGKHNGWTQPVPLIGVQTNPPKTITFEHQDKKLSLRLSEEFMANLGQSTDAATIADAEVVFVGYGIQAPEYDWDDFKDVDVTGKILLMMNNDPEDDPELFEGRKRLYYGRWDYKYKIAAERGAAGAIIIHTTPSAGYPWQVIQTSWSGEEFRLRTDESPACKMTAWLTEDAATKLVELSGHKLDELREEAQSRNFRPVSLQTRFSVNLAGTVRSQDSANVVGILPGSDPKLREQVVLFMAHHDHLGMSAERNIDSDNIYNGAVDNASGTAGLLTIAKAFASLPVPPKRSIMFAAVAAEEQGLLGSKQFAQRPSIHPGLMAAVINIDGANILGLTRDVNLIGNGKSNLDEVVTKIATEQGRIVTPDLFPDRGYYYRSDQFSLAKIGVPGVYFHSGVDVMGKPAGWGKEQLEKWVEETYHQPSDEYQSTWDLGGAIQDLKLLALTGLTLAQQSEMPKWNPGDEFEAARLEALKEANQ